MHLGTMCARDLELKDFVNTQYLPLNDLLDVYPHIVVAKFKAKPAVSLSETFKSCLYCRCV